MEFKDILLIDKPHGITSFDVIRRLRKIYTESHSGEKAPKMGHAGTLDPLATGLMIIGVGKGTKQLTEYIKLDKEYIADILIGAKTTTGDREGDVIERSVVVETVEILRSKISTVLPTLCGTSRLPVSAYSAIKKDGVPMYKRARAAEKEGSVITEVPVRDMTVHEIELLDVFENSNNEVIAQVRFFVASGTYIRSLAEELGRKIGYPASLAELRRTQIGDFKINNSQKLEI